MTSARQLTYEPLVIRKRIDRSSAVLERVLTQDEVVEGTFSFFRTNERGETELSYTTEIQDAKISAITRFTAEMRAGGVTHDEPLEEVAFVVNRVITTWVPSKGAATSPPRDDWQKGEPDSAPPVSPPEPLRRMVADRRSPSRVAAIVPLTVAETQLQRSGTA